MIEIINHSDDGAGGYDVEVLPAHAGPGVVETPEGTHIATFDAVLGGPLWVSVGQHNQLVARQGDHISPVYTIP